MASPWARVVRLPASLRPAVLALLAFVALVGARSAAAVEERVWFSAGPSIVFYDPKVALKDDLGISVSGTGYLNRWLGIEGTYSTASPSREQPYAGDGSYSHFGGGLIATPDRFAWTLPYLYAGIGSVSGKDLAGESKSHSSFHIGAGVLLRAGERLGFRLDARDVTFKDDTFGDGERVNIVQLTGSVTGLFMGRPRDTDEDGVPDKKDKSPETPKGAVVDATGAPLDTDKDGVYDGLDKSPATPLGAKVDAAGVAIDSDGDGVADGIDTCDSTAVGVVVNATGCPVDTDGDHVFDGPDKCPDTPAGALVDAAGCPLDADGDGVADGVDICPYTPAGMAVNAGGCPLQPSETARALSEDYLISLPDFEFAAGSDSLEPAAMARLDEVGAALQQWPQAKVEIGVHVDDGPEPGFRIPLTQMRVRAVFSYLTRKYPSLNPKSFWLTGYGDTDPIYPNTTSGNRARNRRVEFRVMNLNAVYQERVKREAFGSSPAPPTPGLTPKPPSAPQG